jgi:hypothetical protein
MTPRAPGMRPKCRPRGEGDAGGCHDPLPTIRIDTSGAHAFLPSSARGYEGRVRPVARATIFLASCLGARRALSRGATRIGRQTGGLLRRPVYQEIPSKNVPLRCARRSPRCGQRSQLPPKPPSRRRLASAHNTCRVRQSCRHSCSLAQRTRFAGAVGRSLQDPVQERSNTSSCTARL